MTPENFCYWLQGFFEIDKGSKLTPEQVQEIKNHLSLVFNKITPNTEYEGYRVVFPDVYPTSPSSDLKLCSSKPWPSC